MSIKKLLHPERIRKIEGSFSWIDHRFITGGFLEDLSTLEILLYFFLVAVSDRNGLSFYHEDRIASLLKIDLASLGKATEGLVQRSLLAYEPPLYQVPFFAAPSGASALQGGENPKRTRKNNAVFQNHSGGAHMKIETWASIRHLYHVEKLPKKAIARKLCLDPKTVRRALKRETFSSTPPQSRASKLDGYKEKIGELLHHYSTISAVRIHEEIQKLGYPGGISILRPSAKTFLFIRTTPAEEAQVDWAYAGTVSSQKVYCFLMVLSFSGMLYLEFFPSQTLEHFMTGHLRAFHFFQGVPRRIRYDNLTSVVLSRIGSAIQFNPRFLAFAAHYLFDPSPCNVKSPHEKGRVERIIRYVKSNFLSGRTFLSLNDINLQAFSWRDHVANCRIHGTTGKRPIDLFHLQEQSLLIPLPKSDYDTRVTLGVKSTSQSLVKFETNRLSVPFAYASRMLTLKADDQWVSIYDQEKLIAQHQRSRQKYQLIEDPRHYKGLLSSRPQGAYFKHRDAILALGETAHHYVELLTKTELHLPHQIKKIVELVDLYGKTEVLQAMDHALNHHALGHEYLRNIIQANRRKRASSQPLGSPSSKINPDLIRSTWVEERDPGLYDAHFQVKESDHENPET